MHYLTSINTHGEVIASISGNTETVYQLAPHTNAILVLRQEPPKNSYWDFATESWVGVPPKPSEHHAFNYATKQWEDPRTNETEWVVVRARRGRLLAASDWTQLPDVPLATKTTWAAYRQALRDITQQPNPFNIVWPSAPN